MNLLTFADLHDYQKRAIIESIQKEYVALFLGTGLGKTIIILTVIDQLLKRGLINKALIIAPKKAVFNTWRQEAKLWKHTKDYTFSIIHGDAGRGPSERVKRSKLFDKDAQIFLINYEGLPWLSRALATFYNGKAMPFGLVCYDESTKMKHSTTQRFRTFKKFMSMFKYRFPMTGTPIPNGIQDIYGQIYTMDLGDSLGQNITSFRTRFFFALNQGSFNTYVPRKGAKEAIQKRIQNRVIYMKKEDYIRLPPTHYNPMYIDLPDKLKEQYQDLEEKFFLELGESAVEAFSTSALSMKLRQFLQGKIYQGSGKERRTIFIHDEKLQTLKEMVDLKGKTRILEGVGNCIVAYNFQFEREDLKSIFPNAPHIDGSTTDKQAEAAFIEWNRKEHPILLYNPASDPHGLNLQYGGNQLLWYSLTWNLEHYIQLIDRLARQRQEKPVFVHHILFRDTIDDVIYKALISKDRTQTNLLEALKQYRQTATGGNPN